MLGAWLCLSGWRVSAAEPGVSFVTLGDWGGAALGGDSAYAPATVSAVAQQMAKTMVERHARFVINTGDNFYWSVRLQNGQYIRTKRTSVLTSTDICAGVGSRTQVTSKLILIGSSPIATCRRYHGTQRLVITSTATA